MEERRRCARWQVNKEASIKVEDREMPFDCCVEDICLRGVKINSEQKLYNGAHMTLNIPLSQEFSLNNVEASVAWSNASEGQNSYGLHFTKITDFNKENLFRFIHKYLHDQLCQQWWKGLK